MTQGYKNRREAGRILAAELQAYKNAPDTIVLALPRGGVPVADEVCRALNLGLDIWLVRKLGVPGEAELAMGALATGGVLHINDEVMSRLKIDQKALNHAVNAAKGELERRNRIYRAGKAPPDVKGKTVIVVDDGLATGATMSAALLSLRQAGATKLVAAIPVGEENACRNLENIADEVVCPFKPALFFGVGQWYRDFDQTGDLEVCRILGTDSQGFEP